MLLFHTLKGGIHINRLNMGLLTSRIQDAEWDYFEEIEFFFNSYEFFRTEVNTSITKEISQTKNKYDQFLEDNKDILDLTHHLDGEWFEHEHQLAMRLRLTELYYDSLIITMYSFIEKKLHFLCKYLERNQSVKLKHVAGKGITQFRIYLEKVLLIDFSPISYKWDILVGYNKLRNFIVHNEGRREISKSDTKLIEFLKQSEGVKLSDKKGQIVFHFESDAIITHFQSIARRILDYLHFIEH